MDFSAEGQAIDEAIKQGSLSNSKQSHDLVRLYQNRLHWLGYLDSVPANTQIDNTLRLALRAFQKEVGISPSGQPGKKTFKMLEALVAFETEYDRHTIIDALSPDNLALKRAIKLRLSLFGFNTSNPKKILASIHQFKSIITALQIPGTSIAMANTSILSYLFDIDKISTGIRGTGHEIYVKVPASISRLNKPKFVEKIQEFVRHTAAMELWLYGYDIDLSKLASRRININGALKQFWKQAPKHLRPAMSKRKYITYQFFSRINDLQSIDESKSSSVFSTVNEQMVNPTASKQIQKECESLLSRIWDGVKRVVKSILGFLLGVVKKTITLFRNAARWLIDNARKTFDSIKQIYRAGKIGLGPTSKHPKLRVFQDFDKDTVVLVDTSIDLIEANQVMLKNKLRIQLRRIAIKGFIKLFEIIRKLATRFSMATWLIAIWSMTKLKHAFNAIDNLAVVAKAKLNEYLMIPKFVSD